MKIFIPIKQESQRVPNKNFRNFKNEFLYVHTLLKFKEHDIFVDTDSYEILYNCEHDERLNHVYAYPRKKELIGHKTSVCDLIENFINEFKINNETICQLHVTTPLLLQNSINNALNLKINGNYDSVVSCNKIQSRLWTKEEYGYLPVNHNPLKLEQTQDLRSIYEENSAFYIFNSDNFLKTKSRIGLNPLFYEMCFPENLDIDYESDWDILQKLK